MMSNLRKIYRWKFRILAAGFAVLLICLTVRTYRARMADADLVLAVKSGNRLRVTELLNQGANPNVRELTGKPGPNLLANLLMWLKPQKEGRGLLQIAFMDLDVSPSRNEIIEKLILAGANPNGTEGKEDGYPLRAVACEESLSLMSLLLNHGANVNQQGQDGKTALMYAVKYGSLGSVRQLLLNKADPNIKDHNHQTALETAIITRGEPFDLQRKIVIELLEHGVSPNGKNDRGESPLELAIKQGMPDDDQTSLLQTLLEHGADPNQLLTTYRDMTLTSYAGKMGRPDITALLRKYSKPTPPKTGNGAGA